MKAYLWASTYSFLDLLKYFLCFHLVFNVKIRNEEKVIPIWMAISLLCCMIFYSVCGFSKEFYIIPNICTIPLVFLVKKNKRLRSILYVVLTWIVMDMLSELTRVILFAFTDNRLFLFRTEIGCALFHKVLVLFVPVIYHIVVCVVLKKKIDYYLYSYQWGIVFTVFLGMMLIIPTIETVLRGEEISRHDYLVMCLSMIAFFFLFIFVMLWQGFIMKKNIAMKREEIKYQYMLKAQKDYFHELKKRDEELRVFRHDISAHIVALRKYAEDGNVERALDYLKSIEMKANVNSSKKYTGNNAVDAVINDQVRLMNEKKINFSFEGFFNIRNDLSDYDLCTIFFNLLKNAVEACEKVDSDKKSICVKMKNIGENLGIVIDNNTIIKEIPNDQVLQTSKEDKRNHGFGMKSVRSIVTRHNGIYQNVIENGRFVVTIII